MRRHIGPIRFEPVFAAQTRRQHAHIHIGPELAELHGCGQILLHLVLVGGITEIAHDIELIPRPAPVQVHAPEIEIILGRVEIPTGTGRTASGVQGHADPEIAERVVAAKDDAAEIGIVAAIKRARAQIARVFRSIQGIDPEVQSVLTNGPFTRGGHM